MCPSSVPGTCAARVEDVGLASLLGRILAPCFPCGTTALDAFVTEYTGLLKSALTLVEDTCSRPGCTTPAPDPDNWWKCPRDGSPCKWLALENNKTPKSLAATGSERKVLPNPNVPVANYKYPFDTWVTTWPDDDLEIYIKGEKVRPQASGTSYLIPAGMSQDEQSRSLANMNRNIWRRCILQVLARNADPVLRCLLPRHAVHGRGGRAMDARQSRDSGRSRRCH